MSRSQKLRKKTRCRRQQNRLELLQRPILLEPLEPRLLLSADMDLTAGVLSSALSQFESEFASFYNAEKLSGNLDTPLPLLNQIINIYNEDIADPADRADWIFNNAQKVAPSIDSLLSIDIDLNADYTLAGDDTTLDSWDTNDDEKVDFLEFLNGAFLSEIQTWLAGPDSSDPADFETFLEGLDRVFSSALPVDQMDYIGDIDFDIISSNLSDANQVAFDVQFRFTATKELPIDLGRGADELGLSFPNAIEVVTNFDFDMEFGVLTSGETPTADDAFISISNISAGVDAGIDPFIADFDLGFLGLKTFNNSSITLDAQLSGDFVDPSSALQLGFTEGQFGTSAGGGVITATNTPPSLTLDNNVEFLIRIGSGDTVKVTVSSGTYASYNDLFNAVQTGLNAKGLSGIVTASNNGSDKLRLTVVSQNFNDLGFGSELELDATDQTAVNAPALNTPVSFLLAVDHGAPELISIAGAANVDDIVSQLDTAFSGKGITVSKIGGKINLDPGSHHIQISNNLTIDSKTSLSELADAAITLGVDQAIAEIDFNVKVDTDVFNISGLNQTNLEIDFTGDAFAQSLDLSAPDVMDQLRIYLDPTSDITFNNFNNLLNFNEITPTSLLALIRQFGTWLDNARQSELFNSIELPFGGGNLADVLDFQDLIEDTLIFNDGDDGIGGNPDTSKLTEVVDGALLPVFTNAQGLASELNSLGLLDNTIDGTTVEYSNGILTIDIDISHDLIDIDLPADFNLDLSPLLEISSNSSVVLDATAGLQITFGLDLTDLGGELTPDTLLEDIYAGLISEIESGPAVTATNAPVTGRLSDDAVFDITVGGTTYRVTVYAVDPDNGGPLSGADDNSTISDLIADINNALQNAEQIDPAGGTVDLTATHDISASIDSNYSKRIQLSSTSTDFSLVADADDPAVTDLGFKVNHEADGSGPWALSTTKDVPIGRLSDDAVYTITIGGTTYTVTVEASQTAANRTIIDLINDVNNAIATPSLISSAVSVSQLTGDATFGVSINGDPAVNVVVSAASTNGSAYTSFDGATAVNIANNTINVGAHTYLTGDEVVYTSGGETDIDGLLDSTTYYVIVVDANTVKLAETLNDANANQEIDLLAAGVGADHRLTDTANSEFKQLVADINRAIGATALAGLIQAESYIRNSTNKIRLIAIDDTVTDFELTVTAADPADTELGLPTDSPLVADLSDDINVLSQGDHLVFKTTSAFTVNGSGSGFDNLGFTDGQTGNSEDFIINLTDGTQHIITLDSPSSPTTIGDIISRIVGQTGGNIAGLNYAGASDVNDYYGMIFGDVGVKISDDGTGLVLEDLTWTGANGSPVFNIQPTNGSPVAIRLGILKVDPSGDFDGDDDIDGKDGDGIIESNALAGSTLADRFFIENATLSADFDLSSPAISFTNLTMDAGDHKIVTADTAFDLDNIGQYLDITGDADFIAGRYKIVNVDPISGSATLDSSPHNGAGLGSGTAEIKGLQASASFGFVGIDLVGTGQLANDKIVEGSISAGLQEAADTPQDGRILLSELFEDLGNLTDFIAQPTFSGSGGVTLDVILNPSWLFSLPGTPQIDIDISSIGDPFAITDFLSPTWVDSNTFSLTGDQTDIFKRGLVVDVELGSPVIPGEIQGSSYDSNADVTTIDLVSNILSGGSIAAVFAPTPPSLNVDLSDVDLADLVKFENITFDDVLAALQQLATFLSNIEGLDFLNKDIPLINKSVSDLLSFASKLATAVTEMQNDPAGSIQLLEDKLRNAFGLTPTGPGLGLSLDGDILRFDLDLDIGFNESLNVEIPDFLNLDSLGIPGLNGFIDLAGSADLTASGSLEAELDFGIDLGISDINNLGDVYIYETTGVNASLSAGGSNLSFWASLGPFGLFIQNHPDFNSEVAISGAFSFDIKDDVFTDDRAAIGDVLSSLDNFETDISGSVSGTLPTYFPKESKYVGNISIDGDLANISDPGFLTGILDYEDVVNAIKNFDFNDFNLFDNIMLAIDGIDYFLEGLQYLLDTEIFSNLSLPIIGSPFTEGADFIEDFRAQFVQPLRDLLDAVEDAANDFSEADKNLLSKFIYDILSDPAVNLLQSIDAARAATLEADPDFQGYYDTDGADKYIGLTTNFGDYLEGDESVNIEDTFIQWDLAIGGEYTFGKDFKFDIGLPGLGMDADGEIEIKLAWDLDLGFGISYEDGFYFNIEDPNELTAYLIVDLGDTQLTGTLGFLQLTAGVNEVDLGLAFGVNIKEDGATGDDAKKLKFTELGSVDLDFEIAAEAIIDLELELQISSDLVGSSVASGFPSVSANFVLDWGIGSYFDQNDDGNPEDSDFQPISNLIDEVKNGLRFVGFTDVTLDLGSFVSDVLGPIVSKVQDITEPIQPLIDFITTPFPVLSDFGFNITPLDLAAAYGDIDPGLIYAIADIITLINSIPDPDSVGELKIPIGEFALFDDGTSAYTLDEGGGFSVGDLWDGDLDLEAGFDAVQGYIGDIFGDNWFSDALGFVAGEAADIMSGLTEDSGGGEEKPWAFPILEDPMQVFGLFMGRPAVLVTYDMAPLEFEFEWSQFFSIWGPLGVSINVEFGATIDFAFGYDTLGIQEFVESDFRNPALLIDGFYVSDTDLPTGDFGTDVPELVLTGGLWAAAEINLVVARAGVGGGVFIQIDFDLFDPDRDGRVRIKEILGNIYNEFVYGEPFLAPLAVFDVHGEITAELFAFLKVDLFILKVDKRWNITPPITILEFDIPFTRPPILATELEGGNLQINAGQFADQRLNGNIDDISENFVVRDGGSGKIDVKAPGLWDDWQTYSIGTNGTIIFKGGEGDDSFKVDGTLPSTVLFEIDGGVGNDTVILSQSPGAEGAAVIYGSEGDDVIWGSSGDDIIYGLKGNDEIHGGGGNDIIFADNGRIGSESISGFFDPDEDGNDKIYGGGGNDIIFGSGGSDTIFGDDDDSISGDPDNDIIIGDGGKLTFADDMVDKTVANVESITGTQRDRFDPQGGNDILIGSAGMDIIFGGTGNDIIDGGAGQDELYGEEGVDTIYGGGGIDTIYGGEGGDTIYGHRDSAAPADKYDSQDTDDDAGDFIYGQEGRDTIFGDAGLDDGIVAGYDDEIYGGPGADTIDGDGGADIIFGEGDPDWIMGGTGGDIIDGGAGNDVIFGDRGFEDISNTSPLFDGDADVNTADDEIMFASAHGFLTGQPIEYSAGGGTEIGGLEEGETYYVIKTSDTTIKLADTQQDAYNFTARDLTAAGSGTEHVLRPAWNAKVYGYNTLTNYLYMFGVTTSSQPGTDDTEDDIRSGNGSDFLDGQWGSDTYRIRVLGADNDGVITVHDSGDSASQSDFMHIKGTLQDDTFLLRKSASSTGLSFVALLNTAPYAERINYWSVEGGIGLERMLISGLFGDDHFAFDDVGTDTTIEGNEGEDTFQVGQLYNSPRDVCALEYNHVEIEDVYATIETTVGWLSDGINRPMTIYGGTGNDYFTVFHNKAVLSLFGEDGDDTFLIKAFALAGSQEPFRDRTDVSGGAGVDLVQYAMNAPVNIDGGDGFDRVIIIGTEFGDDFVVTKDGVYGAGLNVNFVNVESLSVDGAEGDDRFYVLSTGEDLITELFGGLGSDTFNMSGDTPPIISNDLRGHSGVITHEIENTGTNYDETIIAGISANITDNEEPILVISEPDGTTVITEGGAYDSYYIVLSAAPIGPVTVQVNAPVQTLDQQERKSKLFMVSSPTQLAPTDGTFISLEFDATNWFIPQEVRVSAPDDGDESDDNLPGDPLDPEQYLDSDDFDDNAIEGDQTGFINHVITSGVGIEGEVDSITAVQDDFDSTKYTTEFVDSNPRNSETEAYEPFTDALVGKILRITDGPGAGQSLRVIEVIDGETLILDGKFRECEGSQVGPASMYKITRDIEAQRAITVLVHDNDIANVIVTPSDGSTELFENGDTDTIDIILGRQPEDSDVTVTLSSNDGQLTFSDTTLVFDKDGGDPDPYNVTQTVTVTAFDDIIREGFHHGLITFTSSGGDSDGLSSPTYKDTIVIGAIDGETAAYVGLLNRPAQSGDTYLVSEVKVGGVVRATDTYEIIGNKVIFLTPSGDYEELAVGTQVEVTYQYEEVGYDGLYVKPHLTTIADDEVPQVKITESGDGTDVIEIGGDVTSAGNNFLNDTDANWATWDLTGFSVRITEGTGQGQIREIQSNTITKIMVTSDWDTNPDATSHYEVIVGPPAADNPWIDSYEVVLTQEPTGDVEILVDPQITKTSSGKVIFWGEQVRANSLEAGATNHGDGTVTLLFTPGNWDTPQTVYVTAVDDSNPDGDDTQVFAPQPHTVSDIQGPLYLYGEGGNGSIVDFEPTMLHYETNYMPETDTFAPPNEGVGEDGLTMTVDKDPFFLAAQLLNDEVNDKIVDSATPQEIADTIVAEMMTITLADGIIKMIGDDPVFLKEIGQFRLIVGAVYNSGDDTVTLTFNEAWDLSESWNEFNDDVDSYDIITEYTVTEMSPNFFADESEKIDYLFVYNEDSQADNEIESREGWLTDSTTIGYEGNSIIERFVTDQDGKWLRGLGMRTEDLFLGGVWHPRGITYGDMEVVEINLGDGIDEFNVLDTHVRSDGYQTWTIINTGDEVEEGDGDTVFIDLDSDLTTLYSGTVTDESSFTLDDANAAFMVTENNLGLSGYLVEITGGTGVGQQRLIVSNTATELTVDKAWDVDLDETSQYRILGAEIYTGMATNAENEESVTLVDSTQTFTTANGGLAGHVIEIIDGAGVGTKREIISNTATTLTVSSSWNSELDETTVYRIYGDQDGPISVNTQRGDDTIQASESSIPLILFGGDGQDTIEGGSADDIIFGDRGRVEYVDENGKIVTLLGLARELLDPQYLDDYTINTLTDEDGNFPIQNIDMQGLEGFMISTPDGRGFGQRVLITGNTSDTLTVSPDWNLEDENHIIVIDGATAPDITDDTITVGTHELTTADRVIYTNGGGSSIGGLTDTSTYYVIVVDATTIKLAATEDDANNDIAIDLTALGSGSDHHLTSPLKVLPDGYNVITDFDPINPQNNPTKYRISLIPEDQTDGVKRDPSLIIAIDPMVGDDDVIIGNAGDDKIFGGAADDTINGNDGDDIIFGDHGRLDYTPVEVGGENGPQRGDFVPATLNRVRTTYDDIGGADTIYGDADNDIILGGYNVDPDNLYGNTGDDILIGDNGVLQFVPNTDTPEEPRDVWLDDIQTLSHEIGGQDVISGNAGSDIAIGGTEADTIYGDDAATSAAGADGEDVIIGDNGHIDFTPGQNGRLNAFGGGINLIETTDILNTTGGGDTIEGNAQADVILGGVNNGDVDEIYGDAATPGADDGDDVILGDNGKLDFAYDGDTDLTTLDMISSLPYDDADQQNVILGGADNISGDAGSDVLIGGVGRDTMYGDDAAANNGDDDTKDVLIGDNGDIFLSGDVPATVYALDSGIDLIQTTDTEEATGGGDMIEGNADDDVILGGVNDGDVDVLHGDAAVAGGYDAKDILLGDNGLLDYNTGDDDLTTLDKIQTFDTGSLGGRDVIMGNDDEDIAMGGTGDDDIYGDFYAEVDADGLVTSGPNASAAPGEDILIGDGGEILYENGAITLIHTIEPDQGGSDLILGNDLSDKIMGGFGGDELYGEAMESDLALITSGAGDDWLLGDNGRFDYILASDTIEDRHDVEAHLGGTQVDLDVDSSNLDRVMTTFVTLGGNDVMYGNGGNDTMFGGTATDTMYGDTSDAGSGADGADGIDLMFGDHAKIFPTLPTVDDFFVNNNFFSINTQIEDLGFDDIMFGNGNDDIMVGGQGDDVIFGGLGDDDLIGGFNVANGDDELDAMPGVDQLAIDPAVLADLNPADVNEINDIMDGGGDDDVMAGDNAYIIRQPYGGQPGDLLSPRFRVVGENGLLYTILSNNLEGLADVDVDFQANVTGEYQPHQDMTLVRTVFLYNHDEATQDAAVANPADPRPFGNDIMAGGTEDDEMWGQLGDDIVQGDGQIEMIVPAKLVGAFDPFNPAQDADPSFDIKNVNILSTLASGTDTTLRFDVFETLNDGDDYIEGNGGNDRIYGNLGQDDIIGGSSTLFGLGLNTQRPDGADLIYGGAGNPALLGRNASFGGPDNDITADTVVPAAERHGTDADVILGDNGNIYRIVKQVEADTVYETFNYDRDSVTADGTVDDGYGDLRIRPRAVDLVDYGYSYQDLGGSRDELTFLATAQGEGDLIYGESGDDIIHGMFGNDVIFGNSESDDLYGEIGTDFLLGGAGIDGILGDDGLILTSRNDLTAEPLNGIDALHEDQGPLKNNEEVDTQSLNAEISTPGNIQRAVINIENELNKSVELFTFRTDDLDGQTIGIFGDALRFNDIIFGGLDSDFIHAGDGDDAVSGAEALPAFYSGEGFGFTDVNTLLQAQQNAPVNTDPDLADNPFWFSFAPYNPGDILRYEGNTVTDPALDPHGKTKDEFALYDEFNPRRKIMLDVNGEAVETAAEAVYDFILNFEETEGPLGFEFEDGAKATDGDDRIFGDLGNDWIVGGTGRDHMYGGRGNDLLNMDDNHDSGSGGKVGPHDPPTDPLDNTQSDEFQAYSDIAFGGAGRDIMLLNTGADRAIDWVGEYNSYIVPFSPFGAFQISRTLQPHLPEYLYALSDADGADVTADPAKLNNVVDAQLYVDEKILDIRVDDPDALRHYEPYGEIGLILQQDYDWHAQTGAPNDPQPGNLQGKREIMRRELFTDSAAPMAFANVSGQWDVSKGTYNVNPEVLGQETLSLYHLDMMQPTYMEILVTLNAAKDRAGYKSNGYVIFDYQDANNFKFAGVDVGTDKLQIGHKTEAGWVVDEQIPVQLKSGIDYDLTVVLYGTVATIWVDETVSLEYDFKNPLNDNGMIGLATDNAVASFDDFQVQVLPPVETFRYTDNFDDPFRNLFTEQSGDWTNTDGTLTATVTSSDIAVATHSLDVAAFSRLEFESLIQTDTFGGLVFDYYSLTDFKFAAILPDANQVVIGHYTEDGWNIDAMTEIELDSAQSYTLGVSMLGGMVSVSLDGQAVLGYTFNSILNDGDFGLLSIDGTTTFDDFIVKGDDPTFELLSQDVLIPLKDDFSLLTIR